MPFRNPAPGAGKAAPAWRHLDLFAPLDDDQLDRVQQSLRRYTLEPGERFFSQGQKAERFYYVEHGAIKLFRTSARGDEKVVRVFYPGETFAEAIPFMESQTYPVNAEALEPTSLLGFSNRVFLEVLRESPDACLQLAGDIGRRLRLRLDEVENLTLQSATVRVVRYLLTQVPETAQGAATIDLPMRKGLVASHLAIKAETLSRILHQLAQDGVLTVRGRSLHVPDLDRLRAEAE